MNALGVILALSLMAPNPGEAGCTKVAAVNVPFVSENYQRTKELEAQFEQLRVKFNTERDGMRERLDRMARSLQEELKPGTPEFRERAKQLALTEAESKWFAESEGQKIEEALKQSLREIFGDIQSVVREIADERGYDIVLACDNMPEGQPDTPTQVRQQIVLQKVLYWKPSVEISNDVIERLNSRYASKSTHSGDKPGTQGGSAKPDSAKR